MRFLTVGIFLFLLLPGVSQTAQSRSVQHGVSVSGKTVPLFTQPEPAVSGQGRLPPAAGMAARFDTWIEGLPSGDFSESIYADLAGIQRSAGRTVLQRFVRDNLQHLHIAYSVTVDAVPGGGSLRVTFADSSAPRPTDFPKGETWQVIAPRQYPAPQSVRDGDRISIELFDRGAGVKLIDYIQVGVGDKLAAREGPRRDSYAEDAVFTLTQPQLRIDGADVAAVQLPQTIQGSVVWIYAPGFGRFVLSYSPHPEFGLVEIGEVVEGQMVLTAGGNTLRLDAVDRIAQGAGAYNVYGLRIAAWEPADPKDRDRFAIGSSVGFEPTVQAGSF